ncbi:GNAT family N-acetyltransferase [Rhodopila sp.]|uniref:GNAT family N-acetyltransferase n=1 Tax=Rhodopila sp. TaxID=2480087 RepID=UPI003D0F2232
MTIRIEIVTDSARLAAVRDAWQRLWNQAQSYVFQTHDWLSGWIAGMHGRKEMRLLIGLAWDDDTLIGIMPCAIHRRSGLRMLHWAGQLFSDYCDCLVDPAYPRSVVLKRLWDALWHAGGFDLISLQQVRPDAQCRPLLDLMTGDGEPLQYASRQDRCMRIENHWADGAAFFRSLNKKGRNNHMRGKRILTELGGDVAFEVIEPGQPIGPTIDAITRLKQAWLRTADPNSPLLGADSVVQRAILDNAWASGLTKIFLLTCGGKIAAASVNFVYADRMEAYLTSYDAAYERASPGTILIVEYAQWSFDRGLRHVDFLRGEEAFKFRLANAETLIGSFSGARTLIGRVAISGHRWLARRRQQRVPAIPQVLEAVD